MKTLTMTAMRLCQAVFLSSLAAMTLCPLSAQVVDEEEESYRGWGRSKRSVVLYEGPLAHDQQWVIKRGTTNPHVIGFFGGTCSLIPSNVRNVSGREQVRFEAEYEGLGVWKIAHVDTVVGTAAADTGQRYRYTYYVRSSYTGITTDGKAPNPGRTIPTPTNSGFLQVVPSNVVAAAFEVDDFFLLREEATGRLVADAHVIGWFHRKIDPSEQPPAYFPIVLDGYIVTNLETKAGQAGCDPI